MIPAALLACAPNVARVTLEAVIRVESGGNPLAIHVNGLRLQPAPATSAAAAARTAERYILRGYSVDLGLMQVNSRNLVALGTTVDRVLDPCTNIRDGAAILTADYAGATRSRGDGQPALQAALSAYNTGTFYRGFANGYVARYYGPGGVPAFAGGPHDAAATAISARRAAPPPNPYTAGTTVFAREASDVRIQ
ncbi:MAG TPA: lytic transglycosylase domain-containing protein [Acetobacteraceae bacterium]|nr:lytic transglycosylase domain-containing protein [Acetobacteraceae bacterium]